MVAAVLLAVQTAIASASMTIKWNTHATAPGRVLRHPEASKDAEASRRSIQVGTLMSVKNRTVSVRLADGSIRTFVATDDEVSALRALIGTRIAFRVTP